MARSRTVFSAPRNGVYVGMLGLAAFAMLLGIGALVLEAGDYDWDSQPKAGSVSLPKFESPRPAATPGNAPAPTGGAQAEPLPAPTAVAATPPTPAPAPAPAVPKPQEQAPAVAAAPTPPVTVPADQNRGPRPGFNLTLPQFPKAQPSSAPTEKK